MLTCIEEKNKEDIRFSSDTRSSENSEIFKKRSTQRKKFNLESYQEEIFQNKGEIKNFSVKTERIPALAP